MSENNTRRPEKKYVAFGILHVGFSIIGLYITIATLDSVAFLHASPPGAVKSYYVMTIANVLLIALLGVAGYQLLRRGSAGTSFSKWICLSEVCYILLLPVLWLLPGLRPSVIPVTGIANVGLMVQGAGLYPLISLVMLTRF